MDEKIQLAEIKVYLLQNNGQLKCLISPSFTKPINQRNISYWGEISKSISDFFLDDLYNEIHP